jgi:CubicO group peptidase (beta-lactamase class C family)
LVARAVQIAVEEGVVELDSPAGPPTSTVRHLLAHTSGYSMHTKEVMSEPGKRRIYSNYGFGVLAQMVAREADIEFGRYLAEAVFEPLGMSASELDGGAEAAGYGATSTVADLAVFAADLLRPALVSDEMHAEATEVQFLWVDPDRDLALVALTDRDFGDWAYDLWPALSDSVIAESGSQRTGD